jgi:hypothetical protein
VILTRIKSSLMMIIWWSKHVGVILSVLMCDIWINVLLQTSALVGQLYIVNWNARWNSEISFAIVCISINKINISLNSCSFVYSRLVSFSYETPSCTKPFKTLLKVCRVCIQTSRMLIFTFVPCVLILCIY